MSLLDDRGQVVATWALAGETNPGLEAVDLIARWLVVARRAGTELKLEDVCPELCELLALAGLPVEVKR